MLLYDRRETTSEESLWSQIELRAVAGPAAEKGLTMELLPSTVVRWGRWKKDHPETTVLSSETGYNRNYDRDPYASYRASGGTMFLVEQQRTSDRMSTKDMLVVVRVNDTWKGYPVKEVIAKAGVPGSMQDTVSGRAIQLNVSEGKNVTVTYGDGDGSPPVSYMYWFSFASTYPKAELLRARDRR